MWNPVLQREFLGILRQRKALAMLTAMAAAFSAVVLLRWPSESRIDLSGARAQEVFRVFAYALLAGVVFLAPAFPAVSVVREIRGGTLVLLLNSPLRPLSIYWGKLAGSLGFSLLALATSLPAAAGCIAMGGIDPWGQLGLLYVVLVLLAMEFTVVGLFVSRTAQSLDSAVRLTYAAVFSICFLTLGPYYLYQGQPGWLPWAAAWLHALSPLPIVAEIVGVREVGAQGLASATSLPHFLLASGALIAGLAVATACRFNYRIFDRARSQGTITNERSLAMRSARRMMFLVDPQRRKPGIPWYLNPIMVKEFRCRRFGRLHWLIRLISLCAVISLTLAVAATTSVVDWGVETIGGLMVLLQMVLIVLLTPSLAAGLISTERESGGWDLLRMTPLPSLTIVHGKLMSVVWTLALILCATLPGYLVMIYVQPTMWLQVRIVVTCLAISAVYTMLVSAAVGSLFARAAAATTSTYIVVMALFLGPLLIWMGRGAPFGRQTVERALAINPVGAALATIRSPGFETYELLPVSWWISGLVSAVAFGVLCGQVWRINRPV